MAVTLKCIGGSWRCRSEHRGVPSSYSKPVMAMDGQIREPSAKTKPKFRDNFGGELKLETAVVDRLERIYREGMFAKNGEVLFPAKPLSPGRFSEGRPVKVAYQGMRGSYCQEAAVRAFQRCDAVPFGEGMEEALEAVEAGAASRAVVPVENSLDGTVHRNYDLMLRHEDLRIVGEVLMPVNHCLLAAPGTGINGIRTVVSHPQALSHCRHRLAALGVEAEAVDNAAVAARLLAESGATDTAVIGSRVAAREFGLSVIEEDIQDDNGNVTRFFVLGKNCAVPGAGARAAKTTLAFGMPAAELHKALGIFAMRDIRVAKIETRPRRENPVRVEGSVNYFEYVFVVDVEASAADPAMERALDQLREVAGFVRVLGSYLIDL
uniref:TSA: Wollemia nobilis Ref_Wollemi_Transcript_22433_1469 transcribed RNA sequence n=1 Tax=Wollemia nobilis TaxID=56998 RepID=A0A0C9S4T2_9CONI